MWPCGSIARAVSRRGADRRFWSTIYIYISERRAMTGDQEPDAGTTKDVGSAASDRDLARMESQVKAVGEIQDTARVLDHQAERALCRKFDYRLLPILAVMCKLWLSLPVEPWYGCSCCRISDLFNALDKGNIGNAQTDGLSEGQEKQITIYVSFFKSSSLTGLQT